ncbi:MAG: hypothetical protein ACI4LA_07735 [Emergencia sp.]
MKNRSGKFAMIMAVSLVFVIALTLILCLCEVGGALRIVIGAADAAAALAASCCPVLADR